MTTGDQENVIHLFVFATVPFDISPVGVDDMGLLFMLFARSTPSHVKRGKWCLYSVSRHTEKWELESKKDEFIRWKNVQFKNVMYSLSPIH